MKTLLQIELLLDNDQISEAFTAIEDYLQAYPYPSYEKELMTIRSLFQESNNEWARGVIDKTAYKAQLEQVKKRLYQLLSRLSPRQSPPNRPAKSAARPTKSKGGIFNRAIEKLKDVFTSGASSPARSIPANAEAVERAPQLEEMSAGAGPPEEVNTSTEPPETAEPGTPKPGTATASPFQKGKILYAIPNEMALATVSRCNIKIAPEQISDEELRSGLTAEEKAAATQESLKITSVMKVELQEAQEGDNFEIVSRNNSEQPILPFMATEWSFDITPRRPGHYALLLRVTAKVQVPGFGERPFDVAVLDRAIQVNTSDQAAPKIDFEEQAIPDPNWDSNDEKAVEHALLQGRVDLAIARIVNFVQDKDEDFRNTLLLLQFRWNDNSNQLQHKLISAADWDLVNNQVRFGITQLLEELKRNYAPGITSSNMDWKKEEKLLREQL